MSDKNNKPSDAKIIPISENTTTITHGICTSCQADLTNTLLQVMLKLLPLPKFCPTCKRKIQGPLTITVFKCTDCQADLSNIKPPDPEVYVYCPQCTIELNHENLEKHSIPFKPSQ